MRKSKEYIRAMEIQFDNMKITLNELEHDKEFLQKVLLQVTKNEKE